MSEFLPEETHNRWVEALNAGDVRATLALYESTGMIVAGDGTELTGSAALRSDYESVSALGATIQDEIVRLHIQGDIALLSSRWKAAWTGADGQPRTTEGQTIEVLRRQPDGRWLYAIHEGHASEWFGKD